MLVRLLDDFDIFTHAEQQMFLQSSSLWFSFFVFQQFFFFFLLALCWDELLASTLENPTHDYVGAKGCM